MDGSSSSTSGGSILSSYRIGKRLGVGSFAPVIVAEHTLTGQKVAIKVFDRTKIKRMRVEDEVKIEIKIMKLLIHPHIARLYEVIETATEILVVMEYGECGELYDYIMQKGGRLQEDEARKFFQQMISGVEYCHRNMIVHRDLKNENVVLDSRCNVKIVDFGFSNVIRDGRFLKKSCGSPYYAAPEIVSQQLYAGPEVDVWSCGVILYTLFYGAFPFDDAKGNMTVIFNKIKAGKYNLPDLISPGAKDLIQRILIVDPMKRITIPEIRRHPWFQAHLPRYLTVPPPRIMHQAKKIDEEILERVVKMGFERNHLVESLHNRIQNEGTVAYYLLVDNQVPSGYLGAEFEETMEPGFNRTLLPESTAPAVGHHLPVPGYADCQAMGLRGLQRKWALGLQYRAHPRQIMTQVLNALQQLNVWWKKIGHYNIKGRWLPSNACLHEGMINNHVHNNHYFGDESTIIESDGVTKLPNVVKFEVQIYRTHEENYLLDVQRVQGPQFLFLELCAAFVAQLRVF